MYIFFILCFGGMLMAYLKYSKPNKEEVKKNISIPTPGMKFLLPTVGEVAVLEVREYDENIYVYYIQSYILRDRTIESLSSLELLDSTMFSPLDIFCLQTRLKLEPHEKY